MHILKYWSWGVWLFFLLGCEKNELSTTDFPIIHTGEVTDISSEGAIFHGKISSIGQRSIIDYGFVWDTLPQPTLKDCIFSINDSSSTTVFQRTISYDLLIGKNYHVRTYAKTDYELVYGNETKFTSLGSKPPEIMKFTPSQGWYEAEILIQGENFSSKTHGNHVWLGEIPVSVVEAKPNELKVRLPLFDLDQGVYSFSVTTANGESISQDKFTVEGPIISSFTPTSGAIGSSVTILGKNFSYSKTGASINISIGDKKAQRVEGPTQDRVVVTVPYLSAGRYPIKATIRGNTYQAEELFEVIGPEIASFTPLSGFAGSEIVVQGNHFDLTLHPEIISELEVLKNSRKKFPEILFATANTLTLKIPYRCTIPGKYRIKIDSGLSSDTSQLEFEILSPWKSLGNIPTTESFQQESFVINGKAYVVSLEPENVSVASVRGIYSYDPTNNTWTKEADYPGTDKNRVTTFAIGEDIYICLGRSADADAERSCWIFNTQTNSWRRGVDFPGTPRGFARSFVIDNKAYVVGGIATEETNTDNLKAELWVYDHTNTSWKRLNDLPNSLENSINASTIVYNGEVYYGFGSAFDHSIWKYNPTNDSWIFFVDEPIKEFGTRGFIFDGKLYEVLAADTGGNERKVYMLNIQTLEWKQLPSFFVQSYREQSIRNPFIFTIGQKVYIGGGDITGKGDKRLVEFDPIKLKE